jgi:glycosyltransferase involved in cell wall biosynthesis
MATSFGVLSTFPPTQCGLATFTRALVTYLHRAGAHVGVVRVVDSPRAMVPPVRYELVLGDGDGAQTAADALNTFDVAIVQHEYGIYSGTDGADVLDVLAKVRVPIIAVLHTVLTSPTAHQHQVLASVVRAATMAVTMTETARQRLITGWGVDPAKVVVIPHGADVDRSVSSTGGNRAVRTFLTWGLLGQGKGIEWALHALAGIKDLAPGLLYRVVGQTHPRVLERDGQAYRRNLETIVAAHGLGGMVEFNDCYLDHQALQATVREADVVVLPYDSSEQVTSGVLTEAVAAGKPVISTRFPHAVELLSGGAGILIPQRDPVAIAAAIRRVLTEPGLAQSMAHQARLLAPALLWPAVSDQYIALGRALTRTAARSVA